MLRLFRRETIYDFSFFRYVYSHVEKQLHAYGLKVLLVKLWNIMASKPRLQITGRVKSDLLTREKISAKVHRGSAERSCSVSHVDGRVVRNNRDIEYRYNDDPLVTEGARGSTWPETRIIAFLRKIADPRALYAKILGVSLPLFLFPAARNVRPLPFEFLLIRHF